MRADLSAHLDLMLQCQYGVLPPPLAIASVDTLLPAMPWAGGQRRLLRFTIVQDDATWSGDLLLVTPPGPGPHPVLAGLNFRGLHSTSLDPSLPIQERAAGETVPRGAHAHRWDFPQAIAAGLAVATLHADSVFWDHADPERRAQQPGISALFAGHRDPLAATAWGAIAAWAWGLQRLVDVLRQQPDIAGDRIMVCGHSRMGKAALLAAATDPRISLVIDNQSGTTGGAPSFPKPADAESTATILAHFPHWLCPAFSQWAHRPEALPFAQHHLLQAIAPRPLLLTYAAGDRWADPDGARANLATAGSAWGPLAAQRTRFVLRAGTHNVLPEDWTTWITFLRDQGMLPR